MSPVPVLVTVGSTVVAPVVAPDQPSEFTSTLVLSQATLTMGYTCQQWSWDLVTRVSCVTHDSCPEGLISLRNSQTFLVAPADPGGLTAATSSAGGSSDGDRPRCPTHPGGLVPQHFLEDTGVPTPMGCQEPQTGQDPSPGGAETSRAPVLEKQQMDETGWTVLLSKTAQCTIILQK